LIGNPTNSLATEYTVTSMIVPGGFYRFRVRASNIYGFGVFSNIYRFKASEEPQQLPALSLQTVNQGTQVLISWDYPEDSADTVFEYSIHIRHSNGANFTANDDCNGTE
jgi:hypothetical protein